MTTQGEAVPGAGTYAKLAAPFEETFHDSRGGVDLEYITGEQCISRLNEVLGVGGWSFTVKAHGLNVEADEIWVLGALEAAIPEVGLANREQFGSQKIKRSRSSGAPLDIGFDFKGATTDALKKCASLIGVGLYLSKKEQPHPGVTGAPARAAGQPGGAPATPTGSPPDYFECEECGVPLKTTRFKDGTEWGPEQLAGYGRRKHGKVLCMDHYRAANEAKRTELLGA